MRSWFSSSSKKPQVLGDDFDNGKVAIAQTDSLDGGLGGFGTLDTLETSNPDPRQTNNNNNNKSPQEDNSVFSSSDDNDDDDENDDELGALPPSGSSSFDEESTVGGGGPLFDESDYASVADNATVASYDTRAEGQWRAAKANDFLSDFFENGAKPSPTGEVNDPKLSSKKSKNKSQAASKGKKVEEEEVLNKKNPQKDDHDPFGSSDPFADSDPFANDPDPFTTQATSDVSHPVENGTTHSDDDAHMEEKRRLKKKHSKKVSKKQEKDRKHHKSSKKKSSSKKHKHRSSSKHKSSSSNREVGDDESDEDVSESYSHSQSTFSHNGSASLMEFNNSATTNNHEDDSARRDVDAAVVPEQRQLVSDDGDPASTDDDPSISEGVYSDEEVEDIGGLPSDQELAAKASNHSVDVSIDESAPSEELSGDNDEDEPMDPSENLNSEAASDHESSSREENPDGDASQSQQNGDDPIFQEASETQSQSVPDQSMADESQQNQEAKDELMFDDASGTQEDDSPFKHQNDEGSMGSGKSESSQKKSAFSFTARKRQNSKPEAESEGEQSNSLEESTNNDANDEPATPVNDNSTNTFPGQYEFDGDHSVGESQSAKLLENAKSDESSFDEGQTGFQPPGHANNRRSSVNTFASGWSKASGGEESSSADDQSFTDDDEEDDVSAPLQQDSLEEDLPPRRSSSILSSESTLQADFSAKESSKANAESNLDEPVTSEKVDDDRTSRTSRRRAKAKTQKHHVDSDISDPDEPLTPGSTFGFISEDRTKQQAAFDDEDVSQEAPSRPTRHASLLPSTETQSINSDAEDKVAPFNTDAVPSMPSRRASTGITVNKALTDVNEQNLKEVSNEKVEMRVVAAVATPVSFVGELDVVDHEPSENDTSQEARISEEFDSSAPATKADDINVDSVEGSESTYSQQSSENNAPESSPNEKADDPRKNSVTSSIDENAEAEPEKLDEEDSESDAVSRNSSESASKQESSDNNTKSNEVEKDLAPSENEDGSDSDSDIDEERLSAMMGKLANVVEDAEGNKSEADGKQKSSWGLSWGFGGSSKVKGSQTSSEDKTVEAQNGKPETVSGSAEDKADAALATSGSDNKDDIDKTTDRSLSSWFGSSQKARGENQADKDDTESKASAAESKASSKAPSSAGFFSSVWGGSKKESQTDTLSKNAEDDAEQETGDKPEAKIDPKETPEAVEKDTLSESSQHSTDSHLSNNAEDKGSTNEDQPPKSPEEDSDSDNRSLSTNSAEKDLVDDASVGSESSSEQEAQRMLREKSFDESGNFAPNAFLASLNDSKDEEDAAGDGEGAPVAAGAAFLRSLEEQQAADQENQKDKNEDKDDASVESDDDSSSSSDDSSSDSDSDSDNDGVLKVREAPLLRLENVTAQTRNQIPVDHLQKKHHANWGWGLGAVANAMGVSTHGPTRSTHGIGSTIHGKGPTGISSSDPIPPKSTHAKPAEKAKSVQNKSSVAASVLKSVTEEGDNGEEDKTDTATDATAEPDKAEESPTEENLSKSKENAKELLHKTSDVMPEALANLLPPEPTADEEAKKTFSFSGASKKATEIKEEEEEKPSRKKSKKERKREKKNKGGGGLLGAHFKKNVRKVSRHGDDVSVGTMTMKKKTGDEQQHVAIASSGGFDENAVTKEENRPWEASSRKLKASKMPQTPLGVDNAVPEGEESEGEAMAADSNHGGSFKDELESMMEESMAGQSMLESQMEEESQADTQMDEETAVTEEGEERDELESLTALESALRRHEEEEKEENFDDIWETTSADVSTAIEFERKQRQNFRKKREKLSRKKGKDKSEDEDEKEMKKLRLFDEGKKKGKKKGKKDKGGSDKISTEFLSAIREVFNEDSDAEEASVGSFGLGSAGEEEDDNSDQGSDGGGFGDSDEEESVDDSSSKISKKSRKHRKKHNDDSDDSSDDGKSRRSTRSSRSHRSSRSKMSKMSRRSSRTSSSRRSHSSTRKPKLNPAEILEAEMKRQQGAKAMSISNLKQEMYDRRGTSTTMLKKEFEKKQREKVAAAAGWDDAPAISQVPDKKSGFANEVKIPTAFESFGAKNESGSSELHGDLDSPKKASHDTLSNHLSRWDGDASVNEMDDLRTIQQDGFSVGGGTMGGGFGFGGGMAAHGGGLAGTLGAPDLHDEPKNSGSGLLGAPAAAMSSFGAGGLDGSSELLSSGPSAEMSLPSFGDSKTSTKKETADKADDAMPVFGDFPSMMDTIAEDDGEGERGLLGGDDNWDDGASEGGRSRRSFGVKLKKPKLGFGGLGKKFKRRGGGSSSKSTGSDWGSDDDEFDDGEGLLGG